MKRVPFNITVKEVRAKDIQDSLKKIDFKGRLSGPWEAVYKAPYSLYYWEFNYKDLHTTTVIAILRKLYQTNPDIMFGTLKNNRLDSLYDHNPEDIIDTLLKDDTLYIG